MLFRVRNIRNQGCESIKAWWIGILRETPRIETSRQRCISRDGLESCTDTAQCLRACVVSGFLEQLCSKTRQFVERLTSSISRLSEIHGFPRKLRRLRLPELLAGCEQPIECFAMPPVKLVHGPCRNRRFL